MFVTITFISYFVLYVHQQWWGGGAYRYIGCVELVGVLSVQCVASTCAVLAWDRVVRIDYSTYTLF
jgi:hypothetical protein